MELVGEPLDECLEAVLSLLKAGHGPGSERWERAAIKGGKALGLDADQVAEGLALLAKALLECARRHMSMARFLETAATLGLEPREQRLAVYKFFKRNEAALAVLVGPGQAALPEIRELSWRLDVPVHARSGPAAVDAAEPAFVLQLDTLQGGASGVALQASFADLSHVRDELRAALAEHRGVHAQRVMRYL